jgi:hypothetical protein
LASNAYLRTPRYSMMLNEAAKNQFDIEVDYRRRLWEVADF